MKRFLEVILRNWNSKFLNPNSQSMWQLREQVRSVLTQQAWHGLDEKTALVIIDDILSQYIHPQYEGDNRDRVYSKIEREETVGRMNALYEEEVEREKEDKAKRDGTFEYPMFNSVEEAERSGVNIALLAKRFLERE